jgi:ATP-dependent RNA helicase RhlE
MPFQQFGLPAALLRNVQRLGYVAPTPIQAQAIPAVQAGSDLIATAQTGTGKTAAFLLPVMQQLLNRPRGTTGALVLTPTRELAQQIEAVFRGLAQGTPLRSVLVVGGAPPLPQVQGLRAGVDLVVATPGRLLDQMTRGAGNFAKLHTLILDEADQMFDMGFLPDVKQIIARLPKQRQTLLFSATMPPEVAKLGKAILHNPKTVAIGPQGTTAQGVTQTAFPVPAHRKTALLRHLLEKEEMPSVLVFTRTKHGAKRLAKALSAAGHGVAELHSNRTPAQRARAMQCFRAEAVTVMVATNIAARGLDVRHVTHVVNYDVPNAPEEYVHRIGRTGRAGDKGDALVLVAPDEGNLLARIERQLGHRLPRRHLTDFDYAAKDAPKPQGKPQHQPVGMTETKKKQYRGQGRRR